MCVAPRTQPRLVHMERRRPGMLSRLADGDREGESSRTRAMEEHEDHCYASHTRCLSFVRASLCAVIALRVRTRTSPRLPPFG